MQRNFKLSLNMVCVSTILFGLLLFGCTVKPEYIVDEYSPPTTVAVLPFNNLTNDLDGPVYVRKIFSEQLKQRGYIVKPNDETDEILRGIGITDGGQLPIVKPEELGDILHVEGVIYGDLLEFNYITLGFYYKRTVSASFKLLDAKNGNILWHDKKKVSKIEIALSSKEAWNAFKGQMVEKTVEKTLRIPLRKEIEELVRKTLLTLPRGR